jgi:glycosyltransferase involved in cell wall biosynthesis
MVTYNKTVDFSIIVPVLNEERNIGACFTAIAGLNTPADRFEVLLVDNGSTDRTVALAGEYAKRFDLAIYSRPGVHISAMRNYGVQQSRGKMLAFLDADCIVSPEWLNKALETYQTELHRATADKPPAIVGSAYRIPPDSSWVGKAWYLNSSNRPVTGPVQWIPSGNMIVAREAYLAVGGFDENVQTDEDYELCQRIRARGYSVISNPDISVVHWGTPQTISSFYRKEHWHGRDVFKIFLDSGRTLKNTKAVAFAFVYVLLIAWFAVAGFLAVGKGAFVPLVACVAAAFFVSTVLALRTSFAARQYGYIFYLSVLYTVFGVARAFCILNVSTWAFQPVKKNS